MSRTPEGRTGAAGARGAAAPGLRSPRAGGPGEDGLHRLGEAARARLGPLRALEGLHVLALVGETQPLPTLAGQRMGVERRRQVWGQRHLARRGVEFEPDPDRLGALEPGGFTMAAPERDERRSPHRGDGAAERVAVDGHPDRRPHLAEHLLRVERHGDAAHAPVSNERGGEGLRGHDRQSPAAGPPPGAAGRATPPGPRPGRGKARPAAPNRKGEGFHFLHIPSRDDVFSLVRSHRARTGLLIGAATVGLALAAHYGGGENIFLLLAILSVGALVVYDIASRRGWEKTITEQLQALGRNHDRLVREVARNRTDVAAIKEGLYDAASTVRDMGKDHIPSHSAEARMIEAIIAQLSNIGQKPRAAIAPPADKSVPALVEPDPMDAILQLEVAPPPRLPRTPTALEAELAPDFDKFSDTVILELVRHAVRHDHLDVFAQPIVSLPQRKLRMYEVFARLRAHAGSYIPAARYLELAHKEELVPAIDNLLLLRCLKILRDRRNDDKAMPYILNIASATLHDTGFMNDLVTFLAQHRVLASRLIFELPLQDVEDAGKTLIEVLDGLSQLGGISAS